MTQPTTTVADQLVGYISVHLSASNGNRDYSRVEAEYRSDADLLHVSIGRADLMLSMEPADWRTFIAAIADALPTTE